MIPAVGKAAVSSRVDGLAGEMLKTCVAHGYCSREPFAGACPYANICEQCDSFVAAPELSTAIEAQLAASDGARTPPGSDEPSASTGIGAGRGRRHLRPHDVAIGGEVVLPAAVAGGDEDAG